MEAKFGEFDRAISSEETRLIGWNGNFGWFLLNQLSLKGLKFMDAIREVIENKERV